MDINQNLGNLMKEAQKMQQRMQDAQKELSELKVVGKAANGKLTLEANGKNEMLKCYIHPSLVDPDEIESLQDHVIAAANDVVKQVARVSQEKISKLTAGLNLPKDLTGEGGER